MERKSDSLGFVFDHALKVTSHTEITNVAEGTVDNVLTFDIINAENGEVKAKSQNYDITVEYGELVVLRVSSTLLQTATNGLTTAMRITTMVGITPKIR